MDDWKNMLELDGGFTEWALCFISHAAASTDSNNVNDAAMCLLCS